MAVGTVGDIADFEFKGAPAPAPAVSVSIPPVPFIDIDIDIDIGGCTCIYDSGSKMQQPSDTLPIIYPVES